MVVHANSILIADFAYGAGNVFRRL